MPRSTLSSGRIRAANCRAAARDELSLLLREALKASLDDPDFCAFGWPRLEKTIDFYLRFEAERREALAEIKTEIAGKHAVRARRWFAVRADRARRSPGDRGVTAP